MGSGKGLSFIEMLSNHAAGTEWEQGAMWLGAPKQFIWGGGSAAGVDEDVTGGCDSFVKVERIFKGQVVGEGGEGCCSALAKCENGTLNSCGVFAGRGSVELDAEGA